ncbi:MAG TPA: glycosyltransferase family 2 protein [Candidatus Omnitrophota bacterium]|nr:glycosyltransferase family 2 protein [Candidatus Omnitrophota bacterium]HRY85369.1 glycosyltransferase family 2 protein [Candidatus Omnitrophota bacterium]
MAIYLSVVIPAYNEAERLPQTLDSILGFLKQQSYDSEIVVSDDGSSDQTVQVAEEKLRDFPHQILKTPRNRGKGHAVRQGMLAAKGEYVLFTDADLSTPISEVLRFIAHLLKDQDVVIGSRALPESQVEIHQNFLRETMGKIFNRIARLWAFQGVHDSQCGFKCFRKGVAHDLFSAQKLDGFSFDVEIIYLAQKRGYRILELPVVWRNSPKSRVQVLRDPFLMFRDVLRIRKLHS